MAVTNYYTVNGEIIGEHTVGQSRLDYLTDALGSVVATVDQTLTTKSAARYKPYGADLATTGTQASFGWVGCPGYRRTGRPHSDIYIRRRHPGTLEGRWTTVDPIWPFESAYIYVASEPISFADPTGLGGGIGGAIGAAACSEDPCKVCREKSRNGFPTSWPASYYNTILDAWLKYCPKTCPNLNPSTFICQIQAESGGNPNEPSPDGAAQVNQGLFQISIDVWVDFGCEGSYEDGVFNAFANIRCGIKAMCQPGRVIYGTKPQKHSQRKWKSNTSTNVRSFHCSASRWGTHTGHNTPYDCCMRCP